MLIGRPGGVLSFLPRIAVLAAIVPPPIIPVIPPELAVNRIAPISRDLVGRGPTKAERLALREFQAADMAATKMGVSFAATAKVAAKSGSWTDPATWNLPNGAIPGFGVQAQADVRVPTGVRIVVDAPGTYDLRDVYVDPGARFYFAPSCAPCVFITDTFVWNARSFSLIGEKNARVPYGPQGLDSDGDPTLPPGLDLVHRPLVSPGDTTRGGIMTMAGSHVRWWAEDQKIKYDFDVAPKAGDKVLKFSESVADLRPGNDIELPSMDYSGTTGTDPQYLGPANFWNAANGGNDADGNPDRGGIAGQGDVPGSGIPGGRERPAILGSRRASFKKSFHEVCRVVSVDVAARTVTVKSPLQYDHPHWDDALPDGRLMPAKAYAKLLSGSIRIRALDPSVRMNRGHVMFMHTWDVRLEGVETRDLGRTFVDPSLKTANSHLLLDKSPADGGVPISVNDNVPGRYHLHAHYGGQVFWQPAQVWFRCKAWNQAQFGPSGWLFVAHGSRVNMEECVALNARGACFVWEDGAEIGQAVNCYGSAARGDGFPGGPQSRPEWIDKHNGSSGVVFECQARAIVFKGCRAHGAKYGWLYVKQNVYLLKRIPDTKSLRLVDPVTQGGKNGLTPIDNATYGNEQENIPLWLDCWAVDCDDALLVGHRQFTDREDTTPAIFQRFRSLRCGTAVNLANYTGYYTFRDCVFRGRGSGTAVFIGPQSWQVNFTNITVRNYDNWTEDYGINYQGFYVDIALNGAGLGSMGRVELDFPVQEHPFYGVMDDPANTVSKGTNNGKNVYEIRVPRILSSVSDLPSSLPNVGPYPNNPSLGPIGLATDPFPPGAAVPSYIWADGGSTEIPATGKANTFNYRGFIKDTLGVRRYPDAQTIQNTKQVEFKRERTNWNITGAELAERNGTWQDENGNWFFRARAVEHDRFHGEEGLFEMDRDFALKTGYSLDFLRSVRSYSSPGVFGPPPPLDLRFWPETIQVEFTDAEKGEDISVLGGPISLLDENGNAITETVFNGRWNLLYFGYTHCPDICPTEVARMLDLRDAVPSANLRPIYVTVDPERDTPAVMKAYAESTEEPEFRAFSGSVANAKAARDAYLVTATKMGTDPNLYAMTHSTDVFLLNPAGKVVDVFGPETTDAERIARVNAAVAA